MALRLRFTTALVFSGLLLASSAGCATRPDIVGHNDEAQEWAERQRQEPKDKTRDWPRKHASAEQDASRQPAPAPAAPAQQ